MIEQGALLERSGDRVDFDIAAAVAVIERRYPGLTSKPVVGMFKGMIAHKALRVASGYVSDDEVAEVRAELESL